MIAIIASFTLPKLVRSKPKKEKLSKFNGKNDFGAKNRVLQGTNKCVQRSDESVSRVQGTHLNRNN